MILSAVGPSPYESAKEHDHKNGRLSPVHPAGLPGDNASYELAVANGKKPVSNGTQNGGYPIPPPDYDGTYCKLPPAPLPPLLTDPRD